MTRYSEPRYIKAETICIGDTLRVRSNYDGVLTETVGVITKREHLLRSTEFQVIGGAPLITRYPDGTLQDFWGAAITHITLLDRKATSAPTLEGLEV